VFPHSRQQPSHDITLAVFHQPPDPCRNGCGKHIRELLRPGIDQLVKYDLASYQNEGWE
jgi:hypothetical protein